MFVDLMYLATRIDEALDLGSRLLSATRSVAGGGA
jgi:hypothetical protein